MEKGFWETQENETLKISEMSTTHIENCIRFLNSKMPQHEEDEWLEADLPESMDYMESAVLVMGAKSFKEKIKEFKTELAKRTETQNCIECGELVGEHEVTKNCHGSCRIEI